MVTALYCKILVILGLAFPMAEVISENVPHGYYQLFYVYLFLGSLLFLLFIYIDLVRTKYSLRTKKRGTRRIPSPSSSSGVSSRGGRTHSNNIRGGMDDDSVTEVDMRGGGIEDRMRMGGMSIHGLATGGPAMGAAPMISSENLLPRPRVHYGSFYLRLGAVCKYRNRHFTSHHMVYISIGMSSFNWMTMTSYYIYTGLLPIQKRYAQTHHTTTCVGIYSIPIMI